MEDIQFSQIHLIDSLTQARTILHIGPMTGRSETEVLLDNGPHKPVRLRFAQANARLYGSGIIVSVDSGEGVVKVDEHEPTPFAAVHHGSTLTVDDYRYQAELYAWGERMTMPKLWTAWATDTGPVRDKNEDAIGIYQTRHASFFAVADGVGGANAGELISEYAIQYMLSVFHRNYRYEMDWRPVLQAALERINREVRRFAAVSAAAAGSTLTAVVLQGWDLYAIHVGDSRLYLWNANQLRRLTTEHATFATFAPSSGQGLGREGRDKRNMLLKGIGKNETIEPDLLMLRLQPGDKLLLCTDGVYDRIPDHEVEDLIKTKDIKQLPAQLIEIANERFNNDNASVICVEVMTREPRVEKTPVSAQDRVYIGYNRRWSLKLKASEELNTHDRLVARRQRFLKAFSLVIVALVLVALILLRLWLMRGNDLGSLLPWQAAPTQVLINTPVPAPEGTYTPIAPSNEAASGLEAGVD